jgi:hypothetical protein
MITIVLAVIAGWLVVSAVTAVVCTAVIRGGRQEDVARGYVRERR